LNKENLRKKSNRNPRNKKSFSQTKTTVEGHSSRLEQVEDRISELKDKIEIKEKKIIKLGQTTQELRKEYARTQ
jgi:predicted  nucleic acid-binding Zn-ribbon protein